MQTGYDLTVAICARNPQHATTGRRLLPSITQPASLFRSPITRALDTAAHFMQWYVLFGDAWPGTTGFLGMEVLPAKQGAGLTVGSVSDVSLVILHILNLQNRRDKQQSWLALPCRSPALHVWPSGQHRPSTRSVHCLSTDTTGRLTASCAAWNGDAAKSSPAQGLDILLEALCPRQLYAAYAVHGWDHGVLMAHKQTTECMLGH
jgi:hypothetical protein